MKNVSFKKRKPKLANVSIEVSIPKNKNDIGDKYGKP